jgi:hypothetical protein
VHRRHTIPLFTGPEYGDGFLFIFYWFPSEIKTGHKTSACSINVHTRVMDNSILPTRWQCTRNNVFCCWKNKPPLSRAKRNVYDTYLLRLVYLIVNFFSRPGRERKHESRYVGVFSGYDYELIMSARRTRVFRANPSLCTQGRT